MQGAARTVLASSSLGFSASPIVAGAAVDFGGENPSFVDFFPPFFPVDSPCPMTARRVAGAR